MDTQHFLTIIEYILRQNKVVDWDKATIQTYIENTKKNSVVTIATTSDGKKLFFKAIKPTANPRHLLDYQKGIVLSEVLKKAGVTSFPSILTHGRHEGIFYLFATVVPIENTLSDEKLIPLSSADAGRIIQLHSENQIKIQNYLSNDITEATFLYPYSTISQNFSFLGLIDIFERLLVDAGVIEGKAGYLFAKEILEEKRDVFFTSGKPYLLHGDFAPHNIIFGDEIYFVDWERAFVTFNPFIGESFDLADLYAASYLNEKWQKELHQDTDSFKLCLIFHLLSKMNNILMFGERGKMEVFFEWCRGEYRKILSS